ncbi:hypothetical protein A2164_00910 [Candidatus Curtissbacteria bacterium RBG_13_35_7]|uniref:Uncharacterized protein n=1 Tax=Candidatus Curtissbacteria bacterium RBG_13_35_7 TaxID=1797705 RepID=A0A1F5G1T5_9BACT|nr:MAG: hypothetical protein A2164_00910 [Candidatus Curtissbacteria bacterium RBG_13_35_7]
MQDLLETLLKPLVKDTKKIKIIKTQDNNNIKFTVHVPKEDIAKVIGKGGKMIKSINNLLKIRSIKENVYVNVELEEV